jgi:uncharacterized phage protein (TIGR01671 family)
MRLIKFRAWDKEEKKFYYFDLQSLHGDDGGSVSVDEMFGKDITSFNEFQQFTGLKDKNGKEIYEGDILSLNDYLNHTAIFWIGYDEEDAGFSFNEVGYGQAVPAVVAGRSEIIGNIYENKELIKKK